ncbi:GNAT family N-acetyltransferase [Aurantiacibacter flavus]|uniref:GNAT family N-acetyltransferase n=1 Tax=Aurantiacibacter flavus TaxID=3145232 RepID=A0ABV0CXP6_9SPHN
MSHYPILETERLILSAPTADDIAPMHAIVSDSETGRFLGPVTNPAIQFERFARNAGSWMLYGYGSFMARLHGSDEVIGSVGVFHSWRGMGTDFDNNPEAGWILHRDQAGQGLAMEAMQATFGWFDAAYGPRRVVCMIGVGNGASLRLAGKLGFCAMREAVLPDGDRVTLLVRHP